MFDLEKFSVAVDGLANASVLANDTVRVRVFFDNGYGASVVRGQYTYGGSEGLFEVGVLEGVEGDCSLTYDTPITDDVIGWLTAGDVLELLVRIKGLEPVQ